jgi:hypothetical protein
MTRHGDKVANFYLRVRMVDPATRGDLLRHAQAVLKTNRHAPTFLDFINSEHFVSLPVVARVNGPC